MTTLQQTFEHSFARGEQRGAALSLWQDGCELLSLCGGERSAGGAPWTPGTLVPVFSATKAASAACLLTALYECAQGPELELGALWSACPAPALRVGELLSHQAGLAATAQPASLYDRPACRRALEATRPAWAPPQHGYHPHTYGPLLDVLMEALTGLRVSDWWEQRVRATLGLAFYIGHLPPEQEERVAMLEHAKLSAPLPDTPFYRAFFEPGTPVARAFRSVTGADDLRACNSAAFHGCGCPARGGVASARGLAQFYQALLGRLPGTPFPAQVLEWMQTPMCSGQDLTLLQHTAFTCGAMCEPAELFGRGGFGHAGAGGCHAFCEPGSGRSFAFVMNRMEPGVLPGERVLRLLRALD